MPGFEREDVTGRPIRLRELDLDRFFDPRTVAVVGASDEPGRPTTTLWRKIREWGERTGATVVPVNPGRSTVDDLPAVDRIVDVEGDIDLAVILVGSAVELFEAVLEKKPAFAMIFSAGFAEAGPEGEARQQELVELVASSDTHLLGPNTNLNAFEQFRTDLDGPAIALITQSGHQGRPVFQAQELGIRVSHWAPTGNEVDLEFADFAAWFADRPEVGAIAAYIEGFKDGRTLMLAADRAAQRGVPMVIVKVGRSHEGAAMARSHTGHLAGNDRVTDAVFRQFGIVRVDGLDELTDTAALLARARPPRADGICVYGISGGTGAHMADLCAAAGLPLPSLGADTLATLRECIPGYLHIDNPVDCGGPPVLDERGRRILDALIADPAVGVLVCPITGALPRLTAPLARDLAALAERTDKPVCVVWGSPLFDDPAYADVLVGSRCHVFRTFGNCVGAVKAYVDHHAFQARYRSPFARPVRRPHPAARVAAPLLASEADGSGRSLSEFAAEQVLGAYGIDVPREHLCNSATDAAKAAVDIGFPVVMKASAPGLLHKSEHGLVALGIDSVAEVRRAYTRLVATVHEIEPDRRVDGIIVAEQISDGVETVVGVHHDELFGPVVMFGLGGVFVEVLDDVAFRVPPFDRAEARRMIEETKGVALLRGARGRPPVSLTRLVDTLMAVQRLAVDHAGLIDEIDINPLLVTPDRAVALDALVVTR
jgi:acyl-CoA synthetase (NDP forming)